MLTSEQIADGWLAHDGGSNPSMRGKVAVMFRDGTIRGSRDPLKVPWKHNTIGEKFPELHIIAYRPEQTDAK